jgi:ubiquinone/menaquinone biosynthesis C-methylase UbiE
MARIQVQPLIDHLTSRPFYPKLVVKPWYSLITRYIARYYRDDDVVFLSAGYEEDPPMAVPLAAPDEPKRFNIQLYHRVATQVDLSGKRVLEVGCGHGGGASYLMRTLHPASYTGLDLNPAGIAFCRKRHDLAGLEFVQGDAENLPFPDQSFDAVVNIESSHCYPRLPRFLAEVARVLRPGGHFLYTDFWPYVRVAEWEAALADAPLRLLSQADIKMQVLRGVEMQVQRVIEVKNNQPTTREQVVRALEENSLPKAREPAYLRVITNVGGLGVESLYRRVARDCEYRMYCFAKD